MKLATILLWLLLVAPAGAATVQMSQAPCGHVCFTFDVAVLSAPDGEANDVRAGVDEGGALVVSDAGAPLQPGPGCEAVSGAVRCPGARRLEAWLGDGGDRLVAAVRVHVQGGPGDDRLELSEGSALGDDGADTLACLASCFLAGNSGDDRLSGSDQVDSLETGPGADTVVAGAGDDMIRASAGDRVDGGSGRDHLAADDLQRVDLSGRGPSDLLATGVESLAGGPGDEVLIGDDGANAIAGGGGADRIVCGGGLDWVGAPVASTVLAADCELVEITRVVIDRRARRTRQGLRLHARCVQCPSFLDELRAFTPSGRLVARGRLGARGGTVLLRGVRGRRVPRRVRIRGYRDGRETEKRLSFTVSA